MGIDKFFSQIYILNNFSAIYLSRFRYFLIKILYNKKNYVKKFAESLKKSFNTMKTNSNDNTLH